MTTSRHIRLPHCYYEGTVMVSSTVLFFASFLFSHFVLYFASVLATHPDCLKTVAIVYLF